MREMDKVDFLRHLETLKGDARNDPIIIHDGGEKLFAAISLDDLERFRVLLATAGPWLNGGGADQVPRTGRRPTTGQWLKVGPIEMQALLSMARAMMQGDQRAADRWMDTPQRLYGGSSPREHSRTEDGARDVAHLIHRIRYGIIS